MDTFDQTLALVSRLRVLGYSAVFSYKRSALGKQLKQASDQKARCAVIMGKETITQNQVVLKNMNQGNQDSADREEFLTQTSDWLKKIGL